MSTSKKLMSAFLIASLVTAFVGFVGIDGMDQVNGLLDTIYSRESRAQVLLADARAAVLQVSLSLRDTILRSDPAALAEEQKKIDANLAVFEEQLNAAAKLLVTAEGKAALAEVRKEWPDYLASIKPVLAFARDNKRDKAVEELARTKPLANKLRAQIDLLIENEGATVKATRDDAEALFLKLRAQLLAIVLAAGAGAMLLGWFLARLMARPLVASVAVLRKVAAGDFTARLDVDSHDEMGDMANALNGAISKIREAVSQVSRVSGDIAGAAAKLTGSSREIASGTQTAAASLEESAASLEEITSTVKQNAENAAQADRLAASSREIAERGGRVAAGTVQAMQGISEASRKIADIITAIDEIAFQTNLLALNAAVEAARAGDQGRGFAVVASEVRNLALRSATAAKEIKGLIKDTIRKVEEGGAQVNQSVDVLKEIVQSVKGVIDIIGEIAAGSREQSAGIDQVNTAVSQVDLITQSNAVQTEELSATAKQLSSQAEELQQLVSRFHIVGGNLSGSSHPPSSTREAAARANVASRRAPRASRKAVPVKPLTAVSKPTPPSGRVNGESLEIDGFAEF